MIHTNSIKQLWKYHLDRRAEDVWNARFDEKSLYQFNCAAIRILIFRSFQFYFVRSLFVFNEIMQQKQIYRIWTAFEFKWQTNKQRKMHRIQSDSTNARIRCLNVDVLWDGSSHRYLVHHHWWHENEKQKNSSKRQVKSIFKHRIGLCVSQI